MLGQGRGWHGHCCPEPGYCLWTSTPWLLLTLLPSLGCKGSLIPTVFLKENTNFIQKNKNQKNFQGCQAKLPAGIRIHNLTKLTGAFAKPLFLIGHILVILCCFPAAGSPEGKPATPEVQALTSQPGRSRSRGQERPAASLRLGRRSHRPAGAGRAPWAPHCLWSCL